MANASFKTPQTSSFSISNALDEDSDENWTKKFPPKNAIVVRISGIVNPGQYWVRPLPMTKHTQIEPKGLDAEIYRSEQALAQLYNVAPKANPDGEIKILKPDSLVAVRSKHWYRGRVVNVVHAKEHDVIAKVFLIDYGITLEQIQSKSCIRQLPRRMCLSKPMAKMVFLAGLRPLTLNIDYQIGMESMVQEIAPKWSSYSKEFVNDLWTKSKHKLALLKNWRSDLKGRAHGELVLLGFAKDINLNKLLCSQGHCAFFANLLRGDLETKIVKIMGPRFTSICGPGPAPGSQSLDASADFTSLTLDEISNHFKDNNDSFDQDEMSEAPPDFDWKPFISEEKLEKAIRKNQKKLEYSNRTLSTNSSFCSSVVSNTPNELKKPMTKIEWIMARKKLAARGEILPKSETSQSSIWDECRNIPEYVDSDEDDEDKAQRIKNQQKKQVYNQRSFVMPAGIDIGKFIEEALERMPEPEIGPKQIVPDLLRNPF